MGSRQFLVELALKFSGDGGFNGDSGHSGSLLRSKKDKCAPNAGRVNKTNWSILYSWRSPGHGKKREIAGAKKGIRKKNTNFSYVLEVARPLVQR
jgi:hypothetical protein